MPFSTAARLAFLFALGAARLAADGPYLSVAAGETWQSNVNNAPPPDVTRSAWTTQASAEGAWIASLDFGTLLTSSLQASAEDCPTFHGLDAAGLDGSLTLRRKLGLGAFAPYVSVAAEGGATGYQDTERSEVAGDLAIGAGQRLTDALQVVASVHLGWQSARDEVFSGSYADAGLTLNWDVTETWRLKLLGGWRDGDVVTTYAALGEAGEWYPVDPGAYAYARPYKYISTFGAPYLAYRLRGRTVSGGGALAPALGAHTTLLLQFLRCKTQGYDLYFNNVFSASITPDF